MLYPHWKNVWDYWNHIQEIKISIKELYLCFQKLVSGVLHTFYCGRFPTPGIDPGYIVCNYISL